MGINATKTFLLSVSLIGVLITTTACLPSKVQKEIENTEKKNESLKKEQVHEDMEEVAPEDVELSENQQEILIELNKVSPEDALKENILEERVELEKNVPNKQEKFNNETKFSQYVSNYFYQFHSKKINADMFFDALSPYFHESFKEMLPPDEAHQRRTFEVLQEQFQIHLPSPIQDYWITNVKLDPRSKEGTFYRVYELRNKQLVHYLTYIRPDEEGYWFITDDRPAPPYTINEALEQKAVKEEEE
jgi:hypothetical protein